MRRKLAGGEWLASKPIIEAAAKRVIPFAILAAARHELNVLMRVTGGHSEWMRPRRKKR